MTFLNSSMDWFLGKRSGHMGPDQYLAHDGVRDGRSTSGALLWAQSEAETISVTGNMVNAETKLLHSVSEEIGNYVPAGVAVVDLGPGTATAFKNKTLPIVDRLQTETCILVDESIEFLKQISETRGLKRNLRIKPVVDDIFETEAAYCEMPALVCSFGSTIGNLVSPISRKPPQEGLVEGLSKMARAANSGWMLVAFDSDRDGERIKSFYKKQALFQLNIFDRMAAELPIKGDFEASAFRYEPHWISQSGQLAHIALVVRDMQFRLNGTTISLIEGQKLHIKNSYKFTPQFFEQCSKLAGLEIISSWSDTSPAKIYLLRIPPNELALLPANTIKRRFANELA